MTFLSFQNEVQGGTEPDLETFFSSPVCIWIFSCVIFILESLKYWICKLNHAIPMVKNTSFASY